MTLRQKRGCWRIAAVSDQLKFSPRVRFCSPAALLRIARVISAFGCSTFFVSLSDLAPCWPVWVPSSLPIFADSSVIAVLSGAGLSEGSPANDRFAITDDKSETAATGDR